MGARSVVLASLAFGLLGGCGATEDARPAPAVTTAPGAVVTDDLPATDDRVAEEPAEAEPAPAAEPTPAPTPAPEAAPAAVLALAHRVQDGRIFVELPDREPLERPAHAMPVCADPDWCGFRLWAHPLPSEPTGGRVVVVRPSGELCEGRLAGHVALGVLDPEEAGGGAMTPELAEWRAAALVRGCTATDELFLFAVFPSEGASPVDGRVSHPTGAAARAVREAVARFRADHGGGSPEVRVWRIGDRHYVRLRPCGAACSTADTHEWLYVADADGSTAGLDDEPLIDDVCCTLVTGVVDVDGDGLAEMIVRSGYPADMQSVSLSVSSERIRWSAQLASEWIDGD